MFWRPFYLGSYFCDPQYDVFLHPSSRHVLAHIKAWVIRNRASLTQIHPGYLEGIVALGRRNSEGAIQGNTSVIQGGLHSGIRRFQSGTPFRGRHYKYT